MASKTLIPPEFTDDRPYEDWSRRVNWWKRQTELSADKQGAALASSFKGKALDAVLELDDDVINSENGVTAIMNKLDILFKKNTLTKKIEDIETFEKYFREEHNSVKDFIAEFDKYFNKLKTHKIVYPEDIKGYKLLKGARLQPTEEKLIRATIKDITYDEVVQKLKDVYGEDKPTNSFNIKSETFYTRTETPPDYEEEGAEDYDHLEEQDEANDTFYTPQQRRNNYHSQNFRPNRQAQFTQRRTTSAAQHQNARPQGATSSNWRYSKPGSPPVHPQTRSKGKNPLTRFGTQSTCRICHSINHWEQNCPDKHVNEVSLMIDEVILHANNDTVLKTLVSETWCSAVLDSGATNTVCGQTWFDEFTSSLNSNDKEKISYTDSTKPFRFGDGKIVTSSKMATIPAVIGAKTVSIKTDIVNADIPLLLSKTAMKNAKMSLNFDDDSLSAFDQKIPLKVTTNGLYSLPITKSTQLLDNVCNEKTSNPIVLTVAEEKSDRAIAIKLHRCFAHPSSDRLLRLVNSAGTTWSQNENLKKEIKEVTASCTVCKVFKKPPPRPIVGLPLASEFQESVAMDLKQYQGKQILHLVDLCTRLSAAIFIPNKKRETIVTAIMQIWTSVYGTPKKFMADNGGEFANSEFLTFCEKFGITINTTPAESPWSNGIVERANQTLARSMDKIISDTGCNPEVALLWALNAKNSLLNVAGFSPFQLVLGRNPRLPSTLTDELPAMTQTNMSDMLKTNLNAIHSARTAFIACENDEKIRRALKSNIRASGETKYVTGDKVFYKRDSSTQWHGPGSVIGQMDQQVFVKHGSFYIRVHPCRLQLSKEATRTITEFPHSHASRPDSTLGIPSLSASTPSSPDEGPPSVNEETLNDDVTMPRPEEDNHEPEDEMDSQPSTETTSNEQCSSSSSSPSTAETVQPPTNLLSKVAKVGTKIRYRDYDGDPMREGTITSRGGRAKGVNKNWWNTITTDGTQHAVNLDHVYEWETVPEDTNNFQNDTNDDTNQETIIDNALLLTNKGKELEAKHVELAQWKTMSVYEEVDDNGEECISLRWVIKEKTDENGGQICKARLCVRGFEEEQDFRTDSPTCSREGIRLFLSTAAANNWKIHSMDVKGAFLQGKELDRQVLIRPPREAATSKLWLLRKCAYGLADAPRRWYLRIREELVTLGAVPSKLDNGLFLFKESGILQGIAILHVDDIMWAGNETMLPIIEKLKSTFQISQENDSIFTYIGIHTVQKPDGSITLDQSSYVNSIPTIPLTAERSKDPTQPLNHEETTSLRSALGQLNWLSNMTRPDISYTVSRVSGHVKQATIADIKEVNKLIKHVKETTSTVAFPALDIPSTQVVVFTDSSFNNLEDGGSQGGQIVFLKDKFNRVCPISWRSTRVRRVARSTLSAESLAFADGMDTAAFVSHLAEEFHMIQPGSTVIGITDSRSLYDAASTSTQISDRRLRVEISAIRETKEKGELEILWTSKDNQLADVLTKKGAPYQKLLEVISQGRVDLDTSSNTKQR